ncbi:LysR substrate-binding domain-containing protein [Conexibacter sp. CPCC 206217]|uniref:LysR family transcriptional regulator n=1 Tax=Conexibacter sp. CPCC 206217 TaxID=3064574 RepID=UPI00271A2549|nr:LysR substrate-binding domain-containing protein [Conexibacter sp. CPCC 206217]MDO8213115.1 LysR substrate-binding domain-containing protein [Conexibacter sp. CPCC 206217]
MDLHTRRLRYFFAVAEELHFGRAAARFFVAQQAMSRQIRELEQELGVQLFERTTRAVRLTAAGEELLVAARGALRTLDEGVAAAQRAGRSSVGSLTVGFRFGLALELTDSILAAVAREHPGLRVELRELDYVEPWRAYADGRIDLAILRGPFSERSVRFVPLFSEPLVAAVGQRHPLARKHAVTVAELAEVQLVAADARDPVWHRYWTLEEQLQQPPERLIHTSSLTEELELVAAGVACSVTVAAAARYLSHPGVSYIPITAVEPCTTGLAWKPERETALVRAFVATAVEVRDREHEIVRSIEHPFDDVA